MTGRTRLRHIPGPISASTAPMQSGGAQGLMYDIYVGTPSRLDLRWRRAGTISLSASLPELPRPFHR